MDKFRLALAAALSILLVACGDGAWHPDDDDRGDPAAVPSAPQNLVANAGDGAISLGWDAPATNASGTLTYAVQLSPSASGASTTIAGTRALVRGVRNDVAYTLSVTAANRAGTGPAATIQAEPSAATTSGYRTLAVAGNPEPAGIADAALLRSTSGTIWMTYAAVDASGSGSIRSSAVRLAHSDDGGNSYLYDAEIGTPAPTGLPSGGEWHYRTPWLIEDPTDPIAERRFKLFAHRYFFSLVGPVVDFQTSAIVMWTAATPNGPWADEAVVLGWSSGTPAALQPYVDVRELHASLQECLWFDEGSAAVRDGGIDFALSCAIDDPFAEGRARKIVLLRSSDHAATFSYVATPLVPNDAVALGGDSFSRPALVPGAGAAPLLIATPVVALDGTGLGCIAYPFADPAAGTLFVEEETPQILLNLPPSGTNSGACTWDRGIPQNGILMNDRSGSTLTVQATGKSL